MLQNICLPSALHSFGPLPSIIELKMSNKNCCCVDFNTLLYNYSVIARPIMFLYVR